MTRRTSLLNVFCIIGAIIPIVIYGIAIFKAATVNAECISYFKMAADANSVEIAEKHLSTGIHYLEENNLTEGNTKIFIYKPTDDFGLWYENLKSAQEQLQTLTEMEELSDLEESNALMKLRETLLYSDGAVTHPNYISFYPNHIGWVVTLWTIWLLWVLVFLVWYSYQTLMSE